MTKRPLNATFRLSLTYLPHTLQRERAHTGSYSVGAYFLSSYTSHPIGEQPQALLRKHYEPSHSDHLLPLFARLF